MNDIYISYVKHGCLHSFTALFDEMLGLWNIQMLVLHHKQKKIYLGEYHALYKRARKQIRESDVTHKQDLLDHLEKRYNTIIYSYLEQFIDKIRSTFSKNEIYVEGQKAIDGIHQIIHSYHLDMTITRVYRPSKVIYYFMRGDTIVATYVLCTNNQDHLSLECD